MFDDGFAEECAYIAERCNKYVQMVLASATITEKVKDFIKTVIPTHELLQVGELIPENITQEKLYCSKEDKPDIVLRFLTKQKIRRALVFCNTKVKCTELASFLAANNIYTYQLSSSLDQKGRINTLNLFKDGKIRVLVATDMAARGLHMLNVDCIINYDLPTRQEFYIHRIGRTGRDNKPGRSLSLVCPEDVERMRQLEEIYKLNIQLMPWDDN
ncbi:hypothetical protein COY28_03375 [Candidatus Woesearchaeota archaeon CG_4_10_14_0_2_um_filter_57_5]|nr:MAG: hypothetical protein COY28_03375 [Candidatus Woesearchaeota archaeon CG_4_10_14_0_2_um_filter_57_5]